MLQLLTSVEAKQRVWRTLILLAGLVGCQAVLIGPALTGAKLLLPLDILALESYYLPATPEYAGIQASNPALSDIVLNYEQSRRFSAAEFQAGRLPLWNPYSFAGAPFTHFGKYSPFNLLYYAHPSPFSLAWIQVFQSVLAGLGAYWFFRAVMQVGFWPAAVGAWCYPLTGFYILWLGFPLTFVTTWLPYVLLATDRAVRRPWGWGGPVLAVGTALAIISGHVDVAGQVLLVSGLYALWCLFDEYGKSIVSWRGLGAESALMMGWALGFLLSAPYFLPLFEYAQTGDRIVKRQAGKGEERLPGGWWAWPQIVLPEFYGTMARGSYYLVQGNQLESAAGAYAGLLAALVLAPLAWCSRRHRSINLFWIVLGFISLGWVLNLPGLVTVMRWPGLNMLSHNRFVFAAAFGIVAMAVVGLEVLARGLEQRHGWFAGPLLLLVLLGGWCWLRAGRLPEPIATGLELEIRSGQNVVGVPNLEMVRRIQGNYRHIYMAGAAVCVLGGLCWAVLWSRWRNGRWVGPVFAALWLGELLWNGHGVNPQCDPSLYYPPIPILRELAETGGGRVMGVGCLPANLHEIYGFRDVRGYDGIDPRRLIEVLDLAREKGGQETEYARTQFYVPVLDKTAKGAIKVPALLNMLNVHYLIFRGTPPDGVKPWRQQADYWIAENPEYVPRAFIPGSVKTVTSKEQILSRLGSMSFDPRRVAYVMEEMTWADECRGRAEIVEEIPRRITVKVEMETPGLLVLADEWYEGWRAELDGKEVPIARVNHVLKGVEVPAGTSTVVFSYEPASFILGLKLLAAAGIVWFLWVSIMLWKMKSDSRES